MSDLNEVIFGQVRINCSRIQKTSWSPGYWWFSVLLGTNGI